MEVEDNFDFFSDYADNQTALTAYFAKCNIESVFGSLRNMYENVTVTEDGEYIIPERFLDKNIGDKTMAYNKIIFYCWLIKNYSNLITKLNGYSIPEICSNVLLEYINEKLVKPHLFYEFISSWVMSNTDWIIHLKGDYILGMRAIAKQILSVMNQLPNEELPK